MKQKMWMYIVLGVLLACLFGTSIYIDFISKSDNGLSLLLILQMFLGIIGSLVTLFFGLKVFSSKKSYELLLMAFLEVLFVLGIIIINYIYGYGRVVNYENYIEYMEYVSMEFNILLYMLFVGIIGLLTLTSFINEKFPLITKKNNDD